MCKKTSCLYEYYKTKNMFPIAMHTLVDCLPRFNLLGDKTKADLVLVIYDTFCIISQFIYS